MRGLIYFGVGESAMAHLNPVNNFVVVRHMKATIQMPAVTAESGQLRLSSIHRCE